MLNYLSQRLFLVKSHPPKFILALHEEPAFVLQFLLGEGSFIAGISTHLPALQLLSAVLTELCLTSFSIHMELLESPPQLYRCN